MNHLDTSWCPSCSRQILPKRYLVPVTQQPPNPSPIPAPPPSSPIASAEDTSPTQLPAARHARRSSGTIRQKGGGGLVRGTGRVKPNGTIKRSDPKRDTGSAVPPLTLAAPAATKHHRTVIIDQNPTPLYCSDECRLQDLNTMYGGLSLDYNPDRDPRDSPPLPPVPHNSFSTIPSVADESDCSSPSTSPDSQGSTFTSERNLLSSESPDMNPSIAALARIYDFPPLPPRPTYLDEESRETAIGFDNEYQSGVMMAARRIKETLCPPDSTKTVRPSGQAPRERMPIPGWTDGSDSWRSSVYSLTSPNTPISSTSLTSRDERPAAYSSFVASPHRSTGVYSTIGENNTPMASLPSVGSSRLTDAARANTSDDLYSKYALAFSRRSDSRSSLSGSAPQAQSFPATARRREQNILKPGAEGKLLVPDVKLKASSTSTLSNDGGSISSWRSSSTRSYMRSPLSRQGSELSVGSASDSMDGASDHPELPCSLPTMKRPTVEARSWSYDNVTTYPVMPMPPRKEIRYERRVVDGVATVVETEVEVQPQLKRLFLFPGKERR